MNKQSNDIPQKTTDLSERKRGALYDPLMEAMRSLHRVGSLGAMLESTSSTIQQLKIEAETQRLSLTPPEGWGEPRKTNAEQRDALRLEAERNDPELQDMLRRLRMLTSLHNSIMFRLDHEKDWFAIHCQALQALGSVVSTVTAFTSEHADELGRMLGRLESDYAGLVESIDFALDDVAEIEPLSETSEEEEGLDDGEEEQPW